jgi:predicted dehydrogenase
VNKLEKVRFGVVGLGNMGGHHISYLNSIEGAVLTAVCDADKPRVEKHAKTPEIGKFFNYQDMLNSGQIDAVLIATPHFQHGEIARAAFAKNVHVLCEKPVSVTVKDARRTDEAHAKTPHLKYGLMLQMRTNPLYKKMRDLVAGGDVGEITRATWIVTDWFRTWSYYASGGWRATWSGEGGGVLINQCPHNLDLIQWVTGLSPQRVTAAASVGKTHPIETEDEVSAIIEFGNGAIGHFVTSTGEAPGTNRFEICGDNGKLIAEHGKLSFFRTRKSVRQIREKDPNAFAQVETWEIDIPYKSDAPEGHKLMTQNFVNAILKNEPLIAPGTEGVRGLELGNAMLMSGLTRTPIDFPIDGDQFEQFLKDLDKKYGGKKTLQERKDIVSDMASSFAKP